MEWVSPYHLIFGIVPASLPEGFWRSIGTLRLLLRITSILLILVVLINIASFCRIGAVSFLSDQSWLHCLAGVILLHTCLSIYGMRYAVGRFQRVLVTHSWKICLRCGYVLKGLPANHRCPECNEPYESSTLEKKWKDWMNSQIAYGKTL